MTIRYTEKDFKGVLAALRKNAPPLLPVSVRRKKMRKDRVADCNVGYDSFSRQPTCFVIRIQAGLSVVSQVDALVHEWAHALAWSMDHELHIHGQGWSVAFGRCFRIYEKWCRTQQAA